MGSVVLDPHCADSLIRLLLGRKYRAFTPDFPVARSVSRRELLLALVLNDKIYLPELYWLDAAVRDAIDESEFGPLIDFVPECYSREGLEWSREYIRAAGGLNSWEPHREEVNTYTSRVFVRGVRFRRPLVQANLRHLKRSVDLDTFAPGDFGTEVYQELDAWVLFETEKNTTWSYSRAFKKPSWIPTINPPEEFFDGSFSGEDLPEEARPMYREQLRRLCALFDASACSFALTSFATRRGIPIKSAALKGSVRSGRVGETNLVDFSQGPEAYQLFRIQFGKMRYPVLESLDDVHRLRGDSRLNDYREVINHYVTALTTDFEDASGVLKRFERDLQLAAKSLQSASATSKAMDYIFYASVPVSIMSMVAGIPLGEILVLPATAAAMLVKRRQEKNAGWLLFGRGPL